jgi:hypothetical protein
MGDRGGKKDKEKNKKQKMKKQDEQAKKVLDRTTKKTP